MKHQRIFLFQSDNEFLELLNGFSMILWKATKHIALKMEFVAQKVRHFGVIMMTSAYLENSLTNTG